LGNIKIEEFAPAAQTRGRFDSESSLALKPQAPRRSRRIPSIPPHQHHGASLIAYLFTGWVASIATFLMEAFERIDMGWFALRIIAFIGIRCAAFRSSSAAVRPAAEQRRADRHDKVESSQRPVDIGFSPAESRGQSIIYLGGRSIERSVRGSRRQSENLLHVNFCQNTFLALSIGASIVADFFRADWSNAFFERIDR
jgi:hypothetical protein